MGCGASTIDPNNVDLKHFRMERVLGAGGFGKVHAAYKKTGEDKGTLYAIKELSKVTIIQKKAHDEVFAEKRMLSSLMDPFLCNVHYAFQDERNLYLVMDLALGGDLRFRMNQIIQGNKDQASKQVMSEAELRFDVYCVLLALQYLHTHRIVFRDLKPDNVLIKGDGYLLLTDFGISKYCPNHICKDRSGTHGYMAPEVYRPGHKHTYNSDIFSLGVMMYELTTASRPYKPELLKDTSNLLDNVEELDRTCNVPLNKLRKSEIGSPELISFLEKALCFDPTKRFGTVKEAMEHPFFQSCSEEKFRAFEEKPLFFPDTKVANCDSTNLEVQEIFQDKSALPKPKPEEQPAFAEYKFDAKKSGRESASTLFKGVGFVGVPDEMQNIFTSSYNPGADGESTTAEKSD